MSLKIAHVSDIHIRNLKYHSDYRLVFEDLYRHLERLKPDIVVNTGDTAHTKTQISPEFVEMASEHLRRVGEIAPYHIILGNHDLNLMNRDRQDAITPIIDSIKSDRIFLHKKSGLGFSYERDGQKYNFWVFSLADRDCYPTPSAWAACPEDVNIGLFHGSVSTCVTDMNWRMTHVEHDLSIFDGLDFGFLGDIHKQQFFREKSVAYAGSLIQQNFGEEMDKGFLFWKLGKKGEPHEVDPYTLRGSRAFHTIRLNEDLSIPSMDIEAGSRVRISPPRPLTLVDQKEIEKEVKKRYHPHDIITLSSNNIGEQVVAVGKRFSDIENLRQIAVQERLIRDFLKEKELPDDVMTKVLDMNRRHQIHIDQEDSAARNVSWRINKLAWGNLFNYGENNVIDFGRLSGLTGLFAPNGSGKSNFIDIILETCFDSTTKGINKNIYLINDNKEAATAVADITANDQSYLLERTIEKIKYGTKSEKVKEWGKTSVSFAMIDEDGGQEPLVGTSRPETEQNIRQRLGTYDDFMLTSLFAQWNPMDIISAKETKRKEIIYRFLDLMIFGQKALLAKDEYKEPMRQLEMLEDEELEEVLKNYRLSVTMRKDEIEERMSELTSLEENVRGLDEKIVLLSGQKLKADRFELGDWAGRAKKADLDISSNLRKLHELNERFAAAGIDLGKVLKLESKFDLKLYSGKDDELKKVSSDLQESRRNLEYRENQLKVSQKNSSLLGEVPCGDQFPTCKFLVNAFDSKKKIPSLEELIKQEKEKILFLEKSRDELLPFSQKLDAYHKFIGEKGNLTTRHENLKLQIENVVLKIDGLEASKSKMLEEKTRFEQIEADLIKNDQLDVQISVLQREKDVKVKKLQDSRAKSIEVVRLMGSEQGIVEKLEAQLTQIQEIRTTCLAYEHYIEAMGKDGIAHQILAQKLPLINEEINKILSSVADFGVFLEHDVDEQSIRFFIQYGQYKSRLLELGSGAEKFLASIAIRNALLNISILPKTNMLIIDEGFGKLDPKNLESIQRMFDYLRTVYDHIIVVSHLDSMKDLVDNIIDITTDEEGYAHIFIGE